MTNNFMKYLGIDWGERRIGLALADGETKIATPFRTVGGIDDVARIVVSERVDAVILGKPVSIFNFQFLISKQFEFFLNELKSKVSVPIELIDERLSSKAADALAGTRKIRASRDEIAAMIILQSYLDKYARNL